MSGCGTCKQIGDFMYVGGEFQQVQRGEHGAVVDQAFLARFDVDSRAYDAAFTPALDGRCCPGGRPPPEACW